MQIGDDFLSHEVITMSKGDIETGTTELKITIEGESNMPFWNHDLKVKAILALLNSIDIKDYHENNMFEEGYQSAEEIIRTTNAAFGIDLFDL